MDAVDAVEIWWISTQSLLTNCGVSGKFQRYSADRPKTSCSLNLRHGETEFDIVVWSSGEGELTVAQANRPPELLHFDELNQPSALADLLKRAADLFLEACQQEQRPVAT